MWRVPVRLRTYGSAMWTALDREAQRYSKTGPVVLHVQLDSMQFADGRHDAQSETAPGSERLRSNR